MHAYPSPIIGRRAVYSFQPTKWEPSRGANVNDGELRVGKGVIVWVGTSGSYNYGCIMMLYDDGTLHTHSLENVKVEGPQTEGPYR